MGGSYRENIIQALRGETKELKDIPASRLDWAGPGMVLEMFNDSLGQERDQFIGALGQIIEEGREPLDLLAQVVHMAASLNLGQLYSHVSMLAQKPVAKSEPLRGAIENYLVFLTPVKR